jgi:hypothetical protein
MAVYYIWSIVWFNSEVSLLIFGGGWLDDMFINESGGLKSHIVIMSGLMYSFISDHVCFIKLGAPIFVYYNFYIFLMNFPIIYM